MSQLSHETVCWGIKNKKAFVFLQRLLDKVWHRPTLPHFTAVPSALAGLTSLFGMGRGGHRRYRHLNVFCCFSCVLQVVCCRYYLQLITCNLQLNATMTIIERSKFKRKQQRFCLSVDVV